MGNDMTIAFAARVEKPRINLYHGVPTGTLSITMHAKRRSLRFPSFTLASWTSTSGGRPRTGASIEAPALGFNELKARSVATPCDESGQASGGVAGRFPPAATTRTARTTVRASYSLIVVSHSPPHVIRVTASLSLI